MGLWYRVQRVGRDREPSQTVASKGREQACRARMFSTFSVLQLLMELSGPRWWHTWRLMVEGRWEGKLEERCWRLVEQKNAGSWLGRDFDCSLFCTVSLYVLDRVCSCLRWSKCWHEFVSNSSINHYLLIYLSFWGKKYTKVLSGATFISPLSMFLLCIFREKMKSKKDDHERLSKTL